MFLSTFARSVHERLNYSFWRLPNRLQAGQRRECLALLRRQLDQANAWQEDPEYGDYPWDMLEVRARRDALEIAISYFDAEPPPGGRTIMRRLRSLARRFRVVAAGHEVAGDDQQAYYFRRLREHLEAIVGSLPGPPLRAARVFPAQRCL